MTIEQHAELNDACCLVCGMDWKMLYEKINFSGYCPTLRDDYGSNEFRKAVRVVRARLELKNCPYFYGSKVVG